MTALTRSSQSVSPTHGLYLDDSGQKEFAPEGGTYGPGLSRYFVFGGFFVDFRAAEQLTQELKAAKIKAFSTPYVEVKSNWLRLPNERKKRYLDPFGLTESQLNVFVEDFYSAAFRSPIVLTACVVDKQHLTEDYQERRWYPPAAAYECVVQRVQNELGPTGRRFRVVMDDTSGKTPKSTNYADNLRKHHEQLKRTGCNFFSMRFDALVGELKLVDSKDSNLVQVADLVAYNVFRQFRDYGEEWETAGLSQLPTYDWFARMAGKFRRGPNGRIQGYGVVKFPLRNRVQWGVREK